MEEREMEFKHLEEVLQRYGDEAVELYRKKLYEKDINASGDLANSVKCIIEKNGTSYEVSLQLLEYYKFVENGRHPGKFPPLDKILNWIKVKPVLPKPFNGRVPTPKQLAFLIGRKIATKGTEGRHVLEDTVDELKERFMLEIENAFVEDLSVQLDEVLVMLNNA